MTVEGLAASVVWSGVTAFGLWRLDLLVRHDRVCHERDEQFMADVARNARDAENEIRRTEAHNRMSRHYGKMDIARLKIEASIAKREAKAEKEREASGVKVEIPDDLEAVALTETELWAQDDMRTVIREKYHEHKGDWQAVRRAVGVGELP